MIARALFSKTRCAILALLFSHPDQAFYLRQIVRACGRGVGSVQRELRQLTEVGILTRSVRGQLVYYQANRRCPVFEELKGLIVKTAGVAGVLQAALAPLADRIAVAFMFGSAARAQQRRDSDIDVAVIGEMAFPEVVAALATAQDNLAREINPVVYSAEEFRSKAVARQHFVSRVLKREKVFLIGDECELARLAAQRVAGGA